MRTQRIATRTLQAGPEDGVPAWLLHGNVSSAAFWREVLEAMPARYRAVAPDLRGYGECEAKPIDATRGLRDFSDDVEALRAALGVERMHLVGWSMGGGVALQYAIDHPERVLSLALESPLSPFGFGGTKGPEGTICYPDGAGSGGGSSNPEYVQRLREKDLGEESPFSPRSVMNQFYFKPPFRAQPAREDTFVAEMVKMCSGDDFYPGDLKPSPNWPGVAPGTRGINNAMAPNYCNLSGFVDVSPKPAVLWLRGADDQIVSDSSLLDFGTLGQVGAVPGWPGEDVFPPQPMVSQMRAVLDGYRVRGGHYEEAVFENCGHSPHIEHQTLFMERLADFLARQD